MLGNMTEGRGVGLKGLTLRNFKMFQEFEMDFERYLTVLVGDNGSGKSSILEALRIAIGSFFIKLPGTSGESIPKSAATRIVVPYNEMISIEPQYPVVVAARGYVDGEPMEWYRSLETSKSRTTRIGASSITALCKEWAMRVQEGDASLELPLFAYYGTNRLWKSSVVSATGKIEKQGRFAGYDGCLDACIDYELMRAWFRRKSYAGYVKRIQYQDYELVKDLLASALTRLIDCTDANIIFDPERDDICLSYTDRDGNPHDEAVSSLSDGYRDIFVLLSDMAFRMTLLNPSLGDRVLRETSGVVLIDEVDLHLHPKWQSMIIPLLRDSFPQIQFIVTTHSPIVLSSIRGGSIRLLEDGGSYMADGETYGSDVEGVLRSVMDTESRIPEVADMSHRLNAALAARDISKAEELIAQIEKLIGADDPDLHSSKLTLSLTKMEDEVDSD